MFLCNSAFEQGNLELRNYRNAFIISSSITIITVNISLTGVSL